MLGLRVNKWAAAAERYYFIYTQHRVPRKYRERKNGEIDTLSKCLTRRAVVLSGSILIDGVANLLIEYCLCEKVYFAQICKTP